MKKFLLFCLMAVVACGCINSGKPNLVDVRNIRAEVAQYQALLPPDAGNGVCITQATYDEDTYTMCYVATMQIPENWEITPETATTAKKMVLALLSDQQQVVDILHKGFSIKYEYYNAETDEFLYSFNITKEDL